MRPLEQFIHDRLVICGDLLADREPSVDIAAHIYRGGDALKEEYGEDGVEVVAERIRAAVRQVYGGEPPPPPPQWPRDGRAALEAAIAADKAVEVFRERGVRPDPDPDWRERLNARFRSALAKRTAEIKKKIARRRQSAIPDDLDDRIRRAVADRVSELYRGTWEAKTAYQKGDMVTDRGSLWIARADASNRPGDGDEWQLAVKRGRDARNR